MKFIWILLSSLFLMSGINAYAADNTLNYQNDSIEDSQLSIAEVALGEKQNWIRGTYFDWGRGRDGFGYCYEFTYDGRVVNGGRPVNNNYCERRHPSYFDWGMGRDGYTYCYQFTPHGIPMNQGRPVPNRYCYRR